MSVEKPGEKVSQEKEFADEQKDFSPTDWSYQART